LDHWRVAFASGPTCIPRLSNQDAIFDGNEKVWIGVGIESRALAPAAHDEWALAVEAVEMGQFLVAEVQPNGWFLAKVCSGLNSMPSVPDVSKGGLAVSGLHRPNANGPDEKAVQIVRFGRSSHAVNLQEFSPVPGVCGGAVLLVLAPESVGRNLHVGSRWSSKRTNQKHASDNDAHNRNDDDGQHYR
jgi:hypothetical protein